MNTLKYIYKVFAFWNYRNNESVVKLKTEISKLYKNDSVYIVKNGRDAIYLFLKSLNLPIGSEVALQAFTCNATVNPVLWAGLKPLFVDISEDNFSMSFEDLQKKMNKDVKVLILQHTFGYKADSRIIEYCKKNGVLVIEDCAHTLGNTDMGLSGDACMLSFGFEKVLSSRVGGALILNNKKYVEMLENEVLQSRRMSLFETFLWLVNPIFWRLLRVLPKKIADILGRFLVKSRVLNTGFSVEEINGQVTSPMTRALSGVLANIVLDCLVTIGDNIGKRKEITQIYANIFSKKVGEFLVRYPVVMKSEEDRKKIIEELQTLEYEMPKIWYSQVIFPDETSLSSMKYEKGTCPTAEDISKRIINLPTNVGISKEFAIRLGNKVKELL